MTLFPFVLFAIAAFLCWVLGCMYSWKNYRKSTCAFTFAGIGIMLIYIIGLWITLQRPPLRTMGETRLWYSLFLPLAGIVVYIRWKYKWILSFTLLLATVFLCINIFRPEIQTKTLMPALQSPWFVPHVMVYMMAYALFGAATLMAVYLLFFSKSPTTQHEMELCDNLTNLGLTFMTLGMLMGALWAKEAWGHYWTWDPKETWAAATWMMYLAYLHLRRARPADFEIPLFILITAFVLLQMCWWGINYLPSAMNSSVHTYYQT